MQYPAGTFGEEQMTGILRGAILAIAIAMSLFHLYVGMFGVIEALMLRLIHVAFGLGLLFLLDLETTRAVPDATRREALFRRLGALVCLAWMFAALGYLFWNYREISGERYPYISGLSAVEMVLGFGLAVVVIEAARRTMGWGMAIVAIVFLAYPFIGPWLPGVLHHGGQSFENIVDGLAYTTDGVFGIAIGISATFIVLFIIFSAFLEASGFGDFMLAFAKGVAGTARGGPAKMTILASALMGMITGSAVANVVTVGAFSIPLMKRTGYTKDFAGAVEAAGSTGSQFMPPVMGAQAFIMVQYTGVPYGKICLYSLVPALLYYAGLWINLDLEARRLGIKGLRREEIGPWMRDVVARLHLVLPLVLLVVLLGLDYTPTFAAVWSLVGLIVVACLRRQTRFGPRQFVEALRRGAETSLPVIAASAVAGIIVLSVAITGLGDRFSQMTIDLAQGNLPLALFFTMIASLVLGMGMPTIPAYIVQVGLIVPALVKMGLDLVIAHLFVIYFSCLSMITPPVAIAAYAACGISGGDPFRTGFIAVRIAAVGFIVPFAFAFNPGLLLMGDPLNIVQSVLTAFLSVYGLAAAMQGYLFVPCRWWERVLAFAGALLLIAPQTGADIAGFLLLAAVYARQRYAVRAQAALRAEGLKPGETG